MILIDPRTGSKELLGVLTSNGVKVRLSPDELPAGDFCFEGNGPNGSKILVGIERKTVRDMISSIRTGRFSGHQLPLLCEMYQRYYLIVEGVYGCGDDGVLEEPRGGGKWGPIELKGQRYMHSMLERFLISVEEGSGIRVHRTYSMRDTGKHVLNLWHVWNDKEYEKHKACSAKVDGHVEIRPWSLKRRIAKELPGVGSDRSLAVDKHFTSTGRMINCAEEDWINVPGIGKKTAKKITEAIWGNA